MSYILSQFNQAMTAAEPVDSDTNLTYMTQQIGGVARRRRNAADSGVTGDALNPFFEECVQFNTPLTVGNNYYFHAKIKRLKSDQTFYLYLVNYVDSGINNKTQYLKTIVVQGGSEGEWVDLELIFSPLTTFDCLLFQLQRTIDDYRNETRYPVIVYQELSKINNIITSKIRPNIGLIKIGVQSHPGLMMCINGEEIHIGRSGIYEIRNGVIAVEFFSVVQAAIEDYGNPNGLRDNLNNLVTMEQYLAYLSSKTEVTSLESTNSVCIFDKPKKRAIDAFVLDYMFKEE